jgi:FkbM family methyltransferase
MHTARPRSSGGVLYTRARESVDRRGARVAGTNGAGAEADGWCGPRRGAPAGSRTRATDHQWYPPPMPSRASAHPPAPPRLAPPAVRWLLRQYSRRRLPAASLLMRRCGVLWNPHWAGAPITETRETRTGARIRLDLSDFFQRVAYFRGCYHEMDILAACETCVRRGDLVLDGGANTGLVAVRLAALVGPGGAVIAVEPGPRALESLRWHVDRNRLSNIRVEPVGLSDQAEEVEYKVPDPHNLGAGTLGPAAPRLRAGTRDRTQVRTIPGDSLLDDQDPRPLFIKLDIEGFELRALRGLTRTIDGRRPAVLCELNAETLRLNGASPAMIADFFRDRGYRAFGIRQLGFFRRRAVRLVPMDAAAPGDFRDALFLHPGSIHWERSARARLPEAEPAAERG